MELDATTAGVERGGLANMAEIRILICYVLDSVKEPVPATRLSELLHYNGLANYFEVDLPITPPIQSVPIILPPNTLS